MSALKKMLDKYRGLERVTLRVGIMGEKTYPDGTPVAEVGYVNEYGAPEAHIPPRPFFRSTIANERPDLPRKVASAMNKHDPETALRMVGQHMSDSFTEAVQTWQEPGNAQSTIDKKGFDSPLRANDKLLRNSFSYEISKD